MCVCRWVTIFTKSCHVHSCNHQLRFGLDSFSMCFRTHTHIHLRYSTRFISTNNATHHHHFFYQYQTSSLTYIMNEMQWLAGNFRHICFVHFFLAHVSLSSMPFLCRVCILYSAKSTPANNWFRDKSSWFCEEN